MSMNTAAPTGLSTQLLIADSVAAANGSNDAIATMTQVNGLPASTAVEIQSSLGGLLLPRMSNDTLTSLSATSVPGTMFYNTDIQSIVTMSSRGDFNSSSGTIIAHVTTAQVKALRATPITLISAPAAGYMIVVNRVLVDYVFVTTPYTVPGGSTLAFKIGTNVVATAINATGLLDQGANTLAYTSATNLVTGVANAGFTGLPLKISNTGGAEFTLGDGEVFVYVDYTIIKVG